MLGSDCPNHVEPVHARHLDVEENEIRMERSDRVDGRGSVASYSDDLNAALAAEEILDALSPEWLVVDN